MVIILIVISLKLVYHLIHLVKEKVWATSYFDHLLGFKIYESEEKCIFENKFQKIPIDFKGTSY